MVIRPLSDRAQLILLSPLLVVLSPAIVVLVGSLFVVLTLDRWLGPKGHWTRWYAWLPTRCEPWPEQGFNGWVWLEPIWRKNWYGRTLYMREAPAALQQEQNPS